MRRYCGTRNPTSSPLAVGVMQLDSLGGDDGAAWQLGRRNKSSGRERLAGRPDGECDYGGRTAPHITHWLLGHGLYRGYVREVEAPSGWRRRRRRN